MQLVDSTISDTIDRWERDHWGKHPHWGFGPLSWAVYQRTYSRPMADGQMEGWGNTVARVVRGALEIGARLDEEEVLDGLEMMWRLAAMPAGRMLWQLGTPLPHIIGGDSLANCWYTDLRGVDDYHWALDRMMLGGGVGFRVDLWEARNMHAPPPEVDILLPGETPAGRYGKHLVVPDTREGWTSTCALLLRQSLERVPEWDGRMLVNLSEIRPAGAAIRTFGGRAGGPEMLSVAIRGMLEILNRAWNEKHGKLDVVDVLDLVNVGGKMIASGGVRRSAQIALCPADHSEVSAFLAAKDHTQGPVPAHRHLSNNSLAVTYVGSLDDDFWRTYSAEAGEAVGLFNPKVSSLRGRIADRLPATRPGSKADLYGVNPCGEIPLVDRECCNLGELVLPKLRSPERMRRAANFLYKVQRAVSALPYADRRTERKVHDNRRLGIGVTGVSEFLRHRPVRQLSELYGFISELDRRYARRYSEPRSVRLTCVKPSGTLSILAGVSAGMHQPYAESYLRRVRFAATDPLVEVLDRSGIHVEPEVNGNGLVASFPVAHEGEVTTADNTPALHLLQRHRLLQKHWADNAVSCTVPYSPEELPSIRTWLNRHWCETKAVSFLPRNPSAEAFPQMPYERLDAPVPVSWADTSKLPVRLSCDERTAGVQALLDVECGSSGCPIR